MSARVEKLKEARGEIGSDVQDLLTQVKDLKERYVRVCVWPTIEGCDAHPAEEKEVWSHCAQFALVRIRLTFFSTIAAFPPARSCYPWVLPPAKSFGIDVFLHDCGCY
jgi:hypothetical protein